MEDLVNLLHKIGELKELKRQGWVLKGIPNPESVADHSFRTALVALFLARERDLDVDKCFQMAMLHDLSEAIAGDVTPHDNISREEQLLREAAGLKALFKDVDGSKIIELWKEYEARNTPEGQFVFQLEKMEMLLQAFEYEKKYGDSVESLQEFWDHTKQHITDSQMLEMFRYLEEERKKLPTQKKETHKK